LPSFRRNGKKRSQRNQQQMQDNIQWIKGAQDNKLVVVRKLKFFTTRKAE
jgi:hypothetical protein